MYLRSEEGAVENERGRIKVETGKGGGKKLFFQWKIIGRAKSGDGGSEGTAAINQGTVGIQVTALTHLTCGVSSVTSVTCVV